MHSYHVYFTPAQNVPAEDLLRLVHEFMDQQTRENHSIGYRLLNMTDKASFTEIPDFHLIVDYDSESELKLAFESMKTRYKEEPHKTIIRMVSEFRVAFSIDDNNAEQGAAANR